MENPLPQTQMSAREIMSSKPMRWTASQLQNLSDDDSLDHLGLGGPEALPNFHLISPGLFRSGQPNREGLAQLKEKEVKTVLSLRLNADEERRELSRSGVALESVPMDGLKFPSFGEVDRALALMADAGKRPMLVHCFHGKDRTGVVVAAYRMVIEGWTPQGAAEEARSYGCCAPLFQPLKTYLKLYRRHRTEYPNVDSSSE